MTPAAITPAARSTTKRGRPTAKPRAAAAPRSASGRTSAPPKPARIINPASAPSVPGHRRRLRPQSAPKVPRRVSGPAPGRSAGIALPRPPLGAGFGPARPGRGRIANPRFRPARGTERSAPLPLPRRVLGALRALPDHPLLDRVVRGRTWIAVLGVMLAGIVAMQIEALKLGAGIGRNLQRATSLQSRNEQLRASVAELADDSRIEKLAAGMGMVMPAPDGVGFVSAGHGLVQEAIANIHTPDTPAFLSLITTNGAVTGASPASATPGAVSGSATTGSTGTTSPTTPTSSPPASTQGVSGSTAPTTSPSPSPSPSATGATGTPVTGTQSPSSAPPQAPSSASNGAASTSALAPAQASSPTTSTGGAGVPAAG